MSVSSGALAQHGGDLGEEDVNEKSWGDTDERARMSVDVTTVCTTVAYQGHLCGNKMKKKNDGMNTRANLVIGRLDRVVSRRYWLVAHVLLVLQLPKYDEMIIEPASPSQSL
jgi:hypothetical protein